jgi:hypothetical protein
VCYKPQFGLQLRPSALASWLLTAIWADSIEGFPGVVNLFFKWIGCGCSIGLRNLSCAWCSRCCFCGQSICTLEAFVTCCTTVGTPLACRQCAFPFTLAITMGQLQCLVEAQVPPHPVAMAVRTRSFGHERRLARPPLASRGTVACPSAGACNTELSTTLLDLAARTTPCFKRSLPS